MLGVRIGEKKFRCWTAAVVVGVTILVFLPSLWNGFINYDDVTYVQENPHVAAGLTWDGVRWAFTEVHASYWHPLTWLSHMVDVQLFGLNPAGHHLHSLLLHAASAGLVFFLLCRLFGSPWLAGFLALVFSIHPLRVESVVWIAERKDLLSMVFFLAVLLNYLCWAQTGRRRNFLLACLYFTLGLLSKPMLVSVPVVLLLLDWWPLRRFSAGVGDKAGGPWRRAFRLLLEKSPFVGLAGIFCLITLYTQAGAMAVEGALSLGFRLGNALISTVRYLSLWIWPTGLNVHYPLDNLSGWAIAGAAVLLAVASLGILVTARRAPPLVTGWYWYLFTLLPIIGLVQVGSQALADRFTYIPSLGLLVIAGWVSSCFPAQGRILGPLRALAAIGIVLVLSTLTVRQIGFWKDDLTIFQRAVALYPRDSVARANFGSALLTRGRVAEATVQLEEALRLDPKIGLAWANLGLVQLMAGDPGKAEFYLRRALALEPGRSLVRNNLGAALLAQGKRGEAKSVFRAAVRVDPSNAFSRLRLGIMAQEDGNLQEALVEFTALVRQDPGNAVALLRAGDLCLHFNRWADAEAMYLQAQQSPVFRASACLGLGAARAGRNDLAGAAEALEESLRLDPLRVAAHYELGVVYARQGHFQAAAGELENVVRLAPGHVDAWNNLGALYRQAGDFQRATACFREALRLNPDCLPARQSLEKLEAGATGPPRR